MRFTFILLFSFSVPFASAEESRDKKSLNLDIVNTTSLPVAAKENQSKLDKKDDAKPFQLVMPPQLGLGLCDGS